MWISPVPSVKFYAGRIWIWVKSLFRQTADACRCTFLIDPPGEIQASSEVFAPLVTQATEARKRNLIQPVTHSWTPFSLCKDNDSGSLVLMFLAATLSWRSCQTLQLPSYSRPSCIQNDHRLELNRAAESPRRWFSPDLTLLPTR